MARDYLQEASSVIFKDSVSLGSLLDSDPDGVVGNLLRTVATAQGVMGPTLRKAAAYAPTNRRAKIRDATERVL
jgi:hypothetical protein